MKEEQEGVSEPSKPIDVCRGGGADVGRKGKEKETVVSTNTDLKGLDDGCG